MEQVLPVEEEQLDLIRSNDEATLRKLYRQHYNTITAMVIRNGGSLQEAKDVYQDAMIILLEKLNDEAFVLNCRLKTFLYSVSRNLWLKQLKERGRFAGEPEGDDVIADWDDIYKKEEQYNNMHRALEALGEPCSTIIRDFYLNNASMDDITEKFGYTNADNAKNQKYKCLKRRKKLYFGGNNNNE